MANPSRLLHPVESQAVKSHPEFLKKTAVIVPAYHEERVVSQVLDEILKTFPNVICVDDGSQDQTFKEAKKSKAVVLRHCINVGQGGALETGIQFGLRSGFEYFITMDSDGQHRTSDAYEMLKVLVSENELDIVLGSRFLNQKTQVAVAKKIVLILGTLLSRELHGLKLTDTHNGLRAFNRRAAECIHFNNMDMAHASDIYEIIKNNKLTYKEFPVTIDYTEYSMKKGQSIINSINILIDFIFNRSNR